MPLVVLLTTFGNHVPVMPSKEAVGKIGASLPSQMAAIAVNVGLDAAVMVIAAKPLQPNSLLSVNIMVALPAKVLLATKLPLLSIVPAVVGSTNQVPPIPEPVCVYVADAPAHKLLLPLTVMVGQPATQLVAKFSVALQPLASVAVMV